ncbi:MAG: D-alanyl-D-alanine carboxypeptidase/D-alanyl-D-alanine-endopeptidase [Candidatus Cloacimonetes bacterium]|nr:D-alanyl-D-alanine carboxypeptidase/D-alanyl-D-alanine-endopeptidase [Candidatus Cloacimonadota bacterium]
MNKFQKSIKLFFILIFAFLQTSSIYPIFQNYDSNVEQVRYQPITSDIIALHLRINDILADYDSYGYNYGLRIESLSYPQIFYDVKGDIPFVPASNLKIITSAAAFALLGPDFRWETEFYLNNHGNLYIRPSGDPTWNNSYSSGMINRVTSSIADSLHAKGFSTINNIIIDPGSFQSSSLGMGWKESNRMYTYSAKPSIIAFNDNSIQVNINPNSVGEPAKIGIYPVNTGFEIINNVNTTATRSQQRLSFHTDQMSNILTVSGNIWVNSRTQYRSLAIPRPELYALDVLVEKLEEFGITIRGDAYFHALSGRDIIINNYSHYFSIYSPTLHEITNEINKRSNNFVANQLFLTISDQSWETWGSERIIKQWLIRNHVNIDDLKMFDGSGLAYLNQTTPSLLVNVLRIMADSQWGNEFQNTLAISGVDGTIRNAFQEDILNQRVYAKSGYISGVRGLSGYIRTHDGELLAFSFLVNKDDSRISNFNRIIERILVELATFSRDEIVMGL